jgi:cell division septation protein DedD
MMIGYNRPPPRLHRLAACVALAFLGACSDGAFQTPFGSRNATDSGPAPIDATRLVERDVEAPDVFQLSETGLWDGRPSLGGVWVAHPSASDPERVIIRNETNGRFVIGSLFRRDRDGDGPDLMVSSDAAAALELAAGAPTALNVTALRRQDTPPTDADAEAEAVATAPSLAQAEITTASLDTAPTQPRVGSTSAAPSPLERAYIQIGIFSVQDNANNTGQALRNRGLEPTIYDQTSNDRRFWRVVVGPAQSVAERADMLATVRDLGFDDAYFVTR